MHLAKRERDRICGFLSLMVYNQKPSPCLASETSCIQVASTCKLQFEI